MSSLHIQQKKNTQAMLYRVVYQTRWIRFVVMVLFVFFIMQPATQAFGAEDVIASDEVLVVPSETSEEVTEPTSTVDTEAVTEDASPEEVEFENNDAVPQTEGDGADTDVQTSVANEDASSDEEVVSEEQEQTEVSEEVHDTAAQVDVQTATTTEVTTEELVLFEEVASSTATGAIVPVATTTQDIETGQGTTTTADVSGISSSGESVSDSASDSVSDNASDTSETFDELASDQAVGSEVPATNVVEEVVDETVDTQVGNATVLNEASATSTATTTQLQETAASSSDRIVYVNTPLVSDANRYQFSVDECVLVGGESYYCNKVNLSGSASSENVVFAAPSNGGDTEIFFNTGTEFVQITSNDYVDEAPDFDAESNSIVWHRLIDGRYQIVLYDLDEKQETVLTNTTTNNMEPTKEGDIIVWQRWVQNNWEIVLYDGKEETLITQNNTHDIAPDIQGGYVIWSTNDTDGERQVVVYEIETGLLSYIEDDAGGQVINPRFVLVYDTKFENGDTITKGFDPDTGSLVPLSAQPGEAPLDLPESDPTGETRALIQNKSQSRDESLEKLVISSGTASSTNTNATSTDMLEAETQSIATTTSPGEIQTELDLRATSTETGTENLPLTDFDLIVEPYNEATSTQSSYGTSTEEIVE